MANNNSINIGGVQFTKTDVVKSEQIKRDGETLNSVFLKDGTQITFPNQDAKNEAKITQRDEVLTTHNGPQNYSYVETGNYFTDVERLSGASIMGTDKKDNYTLKGCDNTTVDISQNDHYADSVKFEDATLGKKSYASHNNEVKQNAEDISKFEKPESEQGLFKSKFEKHTGAPGTFKERD